MNHHVVYLELTQCCKSVTLRGGGERERQGERERGRERMAMPDNPVPVWWA